MMLCDDCQQRPASVQVTTLIGQEMRTEHLCAECAKERGAFQFMGNPSLMMHNLMSALLGLGGVQPTVQDGPVCSACGLPFHHFQATGRLGCAQCYQEFSQLLDPVISRMQSGEWHRGKLPRRSGSRIGRQRELQQLRDELGQLVLQESYEQAAVLRDRIRSLESEPEGGAPA